MWHFCNVHACKEFHWRMLSAMSDYVFIPQCIFQNVCLPLLWYLSPKQSLCYIPPAVNQIAWMDWTGDPWMKNSVVFTYYISLRYFSIDRIVTIRYKIRFIISLLPSNLSFKFYHIIIAEYSETQCSLYIKKTNHSTEGPTGIMHPFIEEIFVLVFYYRTPSKWFCCNTQSLWWKLFPVTYHMWCVSGTYFAFTGLKYQVLGSISTSNLLP